MKTKGRNRGRKSRRWSNRSRRSGWNWKSNWNRTRGCFLRNCHRHCHRQCWRLYFFWGTIISWRWSLWWWWWRYNDRLIRHVRRIKFLHRGPFHNSRSIQMGSQIHRLMKYYHATGAFNRKSWTSCKTGVIFISFTTSKTDKIELKTKRSSTGRHFYATQTTYQINIVACEFTE